MTPLWFLCLNALLSLATAAPLRDEAEAWAWCAEPENEIVCSMARDIAEVADSDPLPFAGKDAKGAGAVALVVVAWHESAHLDPGVIDCSACPLGGPRCDRGRSVSAFQLHQGMAWRGNTREDICQDNVLAASLALHWLSYHGRRTKAVGGMYRGYAAGDPAIKSDAAVRMEGMFWKAAGAVRLTDFVFASSRLLP